MKSSVRKEHKAEFLQGNIACAEGAIVAGCKFFAGYPITPASEIAHHMSRRMFEEDGTFIQTEDEIAAIANIIGASWGGVKSMTATSGPGVSLMLENIGLAVVTETPCVIVNVQRGGPSTGSPTIAFQGDMLQPKFGSHGEYQIIALVPSSPQEMFDFTIEAFNKAEKYRTPVFILADSSVGHMREKVEFPFEDEIVLEERKKLETYQGIHQKIFLDENVAPMPIFGKGLKANITGSTHKEDGFRNVSDPQIMDNAIRKLSNKILKHKDDIIIIEENYLDDAKVVIFSYGLVYRAVLETVNTARSEGLKVGSFRPITVWPFPQEQIEELSKKVKTIVVCENNLGQMYPFVKAAANGNAKVIFLPPKILGALYKQEEILNKIKEVI
ncbi:pyruvate ferredoxin oxidoreductase [Candidatus Atribacteria bacterium HGW-Atribacteria-1]|nr:MAG: pyruvate ferredoxin oxidoreductase [Candidatus Atribacteria bacterium HGW-Atribacteria-1]